MDGEAVKGGKAVHGTASQDEARQSRNRTNAHKENSR